MKKFGLVAVSQNFQFWNTAEGKPVWARKIGHSTAVSRDDVEHVFYPDDKIMVIGNTVNGMPLENVRGNPHVILLEGNKYWNPMPKKDAEIEAANLGLNSWDTKVFLVRNKKQSSNGKL